MDTKTRSSYPLANSGQDLNFLLRLGQESDHRSETASSLRSAWRDPSRSTGRETVHCKTSLNNCQVYVGRNP